MRKSIRGNHLLWSCQCRQNYCDVAEETVCILRSHLKISSARCDLNCKSMTIFIRKLLIQVFLVLNDFHSLSLIGLSQRTAESKIICDYAQARAGADLRLLTQGYASSLPRVRYHILFFKICSNKWGSLTELSREWGRLTCRSMMFTILTFASARNCLI